jgi:hypothetical protein
MTTRGVGQSRPAAVGRGSRRPGQRREAVRFGVLHGGIVHRTTRYDDGARWSPSAAGSSRVARIASLRSDACRLSPGAGSASRMRGATGHLTRWRGPFDGRPRCDPRCYPTSQNLVGRPATIRDDDLGNETHVRTMSDDRRRSVSDYGSRGWGFESLRARTPQTTSLTRPDAPHRNRSGTN